MRHGTDHRIEDRRSIWRGVLLLLLSCPTLSLAQSATIENPIFSNGGGVNEGSYGQVSSTIGQGTVTPDTLKGRDDVTTWTGFWRVVTEEGVTEVREERAAGSHAATAILASFPNPFGPTLRVELAIATPGNVELVLHDLLGREVSRIIEGPREPGTVGVEWRQQGLPAGSYLLRLTVDGVERQSVMLQHFE